MFLEVGYKRVGGGMVGPEVNHKRAALEFVAELTGSPRAAEHPANDSSLVHADELPVPMFAVDTNLRCTFWNRRATDATGWTETEVLAMPKFTTSLFSSQSDNEKDCEELLRAAMEGQGPIQEMWSVKTKWGKGMNAVLMANARTDSRGVTSGVVCVVMPLTSPKAEAQQPTLKLDCNVEQILDLEEGEEEGEEERQADEFLAALEQPPSPCCGRMDLYGDPAQGFDEPEGSSVCSQEWCKSEQSSDKGGGGGGGGGSLTQARVMVADADARGRKSLTLMLERCGFEVACVSSPAQALCTFLHDPEGFSLLFVDLAGAQADDYSLIRQLRIAESSASTSPNITSQLVIVAITHLDRWQESTQKDMAAGLDAIINYPLRVQQLRDTLNSLGVQIDHLDFANKSPRASFNSWNNPLILAR